MRRVGSCLIALLFFVAFAAYSDDHPAFYVDKGACPFECCTYREWRAEKPTRLYADPNADSPFVGVAEKGIFVKAETGEVHTTTPGKFIVKRNVHNFRKTIFSRSTPTSAKAISKFGIGESLSKKRLASTIAGQVLKTGAISRSYQTLNGG
jgi:hypothetical protein